MTVKIDGFEIDATEREDHSFDSDVSDYPVERGSDITDNVRARPTTVTLDCLVSNTPIGTLADARSGRGVPSDTAYARMIEIRDNREPVTIETTLRTFENMALTSLSVPRSASDGDSIRFSVSFKQIQFVTNERTTVRTAAPSGKKKGNLGTLVCTRVPPEVPASTAVPGEALTAHQEFERAQQISISDANARDMIGGEFPSSGFDDPLTPTQKAAQQAEGARLHQEQTLAKASRAWGRGLGR